MTTIGKARSLGVALVTYVIATAVAVAVASRPATLAA